MAQPVVMRVNEAMVQTYRDKELKELVDDRVRLGHKYAKIFAPKRTGALQANIRWASAKPRGAYEMAGYYYANIKYARYVNDGTTGPIYPRTAKQLVFRAEGRVGPGTGRFVRRDYVAGQRGQHFMERSLDLAMRASY